MYLTAASNISMSAWMFVNGGAGESAEEGWTGKVAVCCCAGIAGGGADAGFSRPDGGALIAAGRGCILVVSSDIVNMVQPTRILLPGQQAWSRHWHFHKMALKSAAWGQRRASDVRISGHLNFESNGFKRQQTSTVLSARSLTSHNQMLINRHCPLTNRSQGSIYTVVAEPEPKRKPHYNLASNRIPFTGPPMSTPDRCPLSHASALILLTS